jgi:HAD superfamily hydrolase (TIGR01450 family)
VELTSALDLATLYDVFCLDVQGVLMNGAQVARGAPELIREFRQKDKSLCIVTNRFSSSPEKISEELRQVGLPIEGCPVITPREALVRWVGEQNMAQERCVVLGSDADRQFVISTGLCVVGLDELFSILLVGHPEVSLQPRELERAISKLATATERGSKPILLVPNPDFVIPRAGGLGLGPGAAAEVIVSAMARIVGPDAVDVRILGKPGPWLYVLARERFPQGRMVMIGDQMETDIEGAHQAGMDSALLLTGELSKRRWKGDQGRLYPTYGIRQLI